MNDPTCDRCGTGMHKWARFYAWFCLCGRVVPVVRPQLVTP